MAAFERRQPGLSVLSQFDVESTKTTGLVSRLESEAGRPRCDVFWNNEIMHTLRLEEAGLLQSVRWQVPADWPTNMRSAQGCWVGIAARARVLIINGDLLADPSERPESVLDLADPKWKGRAAIASPLYGTTATHFAILDGHLGRAKALEFYNQVKNNVQVLAGNKQVAQMVSSGQLAFGLTDTDDALIEIASGLPVEIVFPDQMADEFGTLRIPNTVAVMKGAPHPVAATALANYLVSEDTEGRLALGPSAQIPIRPGHPQSSRAVKTAVRWMDGDFSQAAKRWPELATQLRAIYQ
ncbi:MAG: extracellular solute-binding protein [Planctomycetales bacterium]|nr:extracellular solute-binding protein [Planctomycetales bacterium]